MVDLWSLVKHIFQTQQALMPRFAPISILALAYVIYQKFNFSSLIPNQHIVDLTFLGLLVIFIIHAFVTFPHERRWIEKINEAINAMNWSLAKEELDLPPAYLSHRARYLRDLARARLLYARCQYEGALDELLRLGKTALTDGENFKRRMQLAMVYSATGNILSFKSEVKKLTDLGTPRQISDQLSLLLLKAKQLEFDGDLKESKSLLESGLTLCSTGKDLATCYINLGRLEDLRANERVALSYFQRAWDELKQDPIPRYFHIVGHNLLMKYGRTGDVYNAKVILEEYRNLTVGKAPDLLLEFYNDQTHLARQLSDRAMLEESYRQVAGMVEYDEKARYCIAAHELRMRLGDNLDFVPTFNYVFERPLKIDLTDDERFNTLEQLKAVWQQSKEQFPPIIWEEYGRFITSSYLTYEAIVDKRLQDISPSLPAIRDIWLKRSLEILRIKIGNHQALTSDTFNPLLERMAERYRLWSDCENTHQEIECRIAYIDDYIAYERLMPTDTLIKYRPEVLSTLAEAEDLLDKRWPIAKPDHAIGIAYQIWKLTGNTEKREKWITRFDDIKLSLEHYLPWLRSQYHEMKADINPYIAK